MENLIDLGSEVRDLVTGFKGTVTARVEYLNGCVQYCVQPRAKKNTFARAEFIDAQQLEVTATAPLNLTSISARETGGPSRHEPPSRYKG